MTLSILDRVNREGLKSGLARQELRARVRGAGEENVRYEFLSPSSPRRRGRGNDAERGSPVSSLARSRQPVVWFVSPYPHPLSPPPGRKGGASSDLFDPRPGQPGAVEIWAGSAGTQGASSERRKRNFSTEKGAEEGAKTGIDRGSPGSSLARSRQPVVCLPDCYPVRPAQHHSCPAGAVATFAP